MQQQLSGDLAGAAGQPHPSWCVRPADEPASELHASEAIACSVGSDESVAMSVRLHTFWPPEDHRSPLVSLEITENDQKRWFPIPQGQARALHEALAAVLSLG
jgi:hypothetical protein